MKVTYLQEYCMSRVGLTNIPWYDLEVGEIMTCYPGCASFRRTELGIDLRYSHSGEWHKNWMPEESRAEWQESRRDLMSLFGTIISCE